MGFQRARSPGRGCVAGSGFVRCQDPLPAGRLYLFGRDGAGAQQHRSATRAVDDGGLYADRAGAAVEYQQALAKLTRYMGRRGRADTAELVGAGPGQTHHPQGAAGAQQGLRHRVGRAAQTDRVLATSRRAAHAGAARKDQRQRAGPEGLHQLLRKGRYFSSKMRHTGGALKFVVHMHDQRMLAGPALGLENFGYRQVVTGVGAQAIHGFTRKRDQLTRLQSRCTAGYNPAFKSVQDHGPVTVRRAGPRRPRPALPKHVPGRCFRR